MSELLLLCIVVNISSNVVYWNYTTLEQHQQKRKEGIGDKSEKHQEKTAGRGKDPAPNNLSEG